MHGKRELVWKIILKISETDQKILLPFNKAVTNSYYN